MMENFFGIVKSELLYSQNFKSIEEFSRELKYYIEYYNNDRIKVKLKGMSPVKYRTHSLQNKLLICPTFWVQFTCDRLFLIEM